MTDTNVKNDVNNVLNDHDEEYTDEMKKKDILFSRFQNLSKYMDNDVISSPATFENFSDLIIDDYDLYKFNNERFQFYMELKKILDKDPRILRMILNLNNKTKLKKKKEKKVLQKLTKIFAKMFKQKKEEAIKQAEVDEKFQKDFEGNNPQEQTQSKVEQQKKIDMKNKADGAYEEFITSFSNKIEENLKKKYNFSPSKLSDTNDLRKPIEKLFNATTQIKLANRVVNAFKYNKEHKTGGAYYTRYIKPDDSSETTETNFDIDNIRKKAQKAEATSEEVNKVAAEEANKLYNLLTKTGYNEDNEDQLRGYLAYKYNLSNLQNLNKNILNMTDADTNDRFSKDNSSMRTFVEDYYKAFNHSDPDKVNKSLKKAIEKMKDSPDNPLEVFKITREDRLVFILVTFFLRYVTILMVQWCVDINIIRDFYQGFLLYAFIYIVVFWFIVMFVNIDNIPKATYMNFDSGITFIRNLFYYFYMGTNGITRLLTHTLLIIILLIIPVILNIRQKKEQDTDNDLLNYEERKKLIKTLSLFTIFVWILTSIIATKY